jgi:hypothetical protein
MTHTNDEVDDFDRFLEGPPAGPDRANGHRSELARAAGLLFALDARDVAPDPRPGFITRLEEQLAMHASAPTRARSITAASLGSHPTRASAPRLAVPDAGSAKWLVTAALMIAIVLVASILFRDGSDEPDSNASGMNPTSDAVSPLAFEPVDIAECTAPAGQVGTVWSLIGETPSLPAALPDVVDLARFGTPTTGAVILPDGGRYLLSPHSAAQPDVVNGLNATLRQATACRFATVGPAPDGPWYWLDGAFFASFSDDFFRREAFLGMDDTGKSRALVDTPFMPVGPTPWVVEAARMLPDGRAIAIVSPGQPVEVPFGTLVMIFVRTGDRWQIDEALRVEPRIMNSYGIDAPRYLELTLDDPNGSTIVPPNGDTTFYAHRPVTVTVANLGDTPQQFHIDGLDIVVEIEPGHSVSFSLVAPMGAYVMESYVASDGVFSALRYEAILRFVDEGTPLPTDYSPSGADEGLAERMAVSNAG